MGEIRFVGTGETRGYPYLVCKKLLSLQIGCSFVRATVAWAMLERISGIEPSSEITE